jgi:tetratricopeptide (TPR) repeat protein
VDWRAGIIEHFEHNLRRMIDKCQARGVPVIVLLPPSNLSDCAPFKSQHRDGLSEKELNEWNVLENSTHDAIRNSAADAVEILKKMIDIDPEYAATHYQLGKCYESLGMFEPARESFVRARDFDICPLRMISELENALRSVVADYDVPFIDAHELLERRSRNGILGGPILCDRVHPSFEGHQWIADALIRKMAELRLVEPTTGWEERAKRAYDRHFAALDPAYFLKGQRTIDAVNLWTRGQTEGPPIEVRAPHRIAPGD